MSDLIALPPSAEQLAESTRVRLVSAGTDSPPLTTPTGPIPNGYFFRQDVPSDHWKILHGLGRYPQITVQASIGDEALVVSDGEVDYRSLDEITVRLSEPGAGWAWLQ